MFLLQAINGIVQITSTPVSTILFRILSTKLLSRASSESRIPQKGVVTISFALALATPGPEFFCFNNDIRSSRVIYSSIICTDESFDSSSIHIRLAL